MSGQHIALLVAFVVVTSLVAAGWMRGRGRSNRVEDAIMRGGYPWIEPRI